MIEVVFQLAKKGSTSITLVLSLRFSYSDF